jgi:uncharacterized protein (DUF58 family)
VWFSDIFRRREAGRPALADDSAESLTDASFLRRLDRLALRTNRRLPGQATGQRASFRRIPASDFREHRLYLPGDDLRHVDWNASARVEHVFIKMGERPKEATVHVLLDTTASMQWGKPSKLWSGRRLAAALGYIALSHGDRLIVSGLGAEGGVFGPSHGKGRMPSMLRFVRDAPPQARLDLAAAARRHAARFPQGGLVAFISDLLSVPDINALLGAFPAPKWQVLLLHTLHPAELDPELRGQVELLDVETGQRANYDIDEKVVERYVAFVRNWCERIEQACFDGTAAYARVPTDWPIEKAVVPYLQRRGVVQAA